MTFALLRQIGRLFPAAFCLGMAWVCLLPSPAAATHRAQVLVLHSYHQGFRWTDDINEGVTTVLHPQGVELLYEYMDAKRIETPEYEQRLLELYRVKFKGMHFDAILSSDDNAFTFLLQHRDEIFGPIPWVFCGVNYVDLSLLKGVRNVTGINEMADLERNLKLAMGLFPRTRRLYIVFDQSTTGERIRDYLHPLLQHHAPDLKISTLEQLSMEQIEQTLRQAPADSLVLYTVYSRDALGRFYEFDESIRRVVQASPAPVFITWDFSLGSGAVGGYLTNGRDQGKAAARLVLRILNGENAESIPVEMKSPARYMFDYAALQRFGIPLSRLPAGSMVVGAPSRTYPIDKRLLGTLVSVAFAIAAFAVAITLAFIWRRRAQQALAENEARLRTVVEHLPAGALYIDRNDFTFNQGVERIIDYPRDEFAGVDDWFNRLFGDKAESIRQQWEREKRLGFPRVLKNLPVRRKDGTIRYCDLGSWYDQDHDRMVVLMYDNTERKLTEDALRDSEVRHRILADSIPQNVFVKNRELIYTFCNRRYGELLQMAPVQVVGKTDYDFHPQEVADKYRRDDMQVMTSGEVLEQDEEYHVSKGHRTVHTIKAPLRNQRGEITGVIGLFRDVTRERENEERLHQVLAEAQETRDKIGTIIQAVSDGLIVLDQGLTVQLINSAAQDQLTGYLLPGQGQPLDDLLQPCELRDYLHGIFIRPLENRPQDITLPPAREGTKARVFQAKTSYLRNEAGLRTGAVTLLREVTHDRELSRMKNEFISTAAHELRTPLTSIMGFAELLLDQAFSPEQQRDFLTEIYDNSDALARLVAELLDISRIESGRPVPLERRACSLRDKLNKAVHQYRLNYPGHQFVLELLPEEVDDVYADPAKVMQILENLLSNAVKYSPPGSRVEIRERTVGGEYRIAVTDNGIGMTRDQLNRMFDRFYRAEATETRVPGLGLGMSIVHAIVLAHGGEIEVSSTFGQGTTVEVALPRQRPTSR